MKYRNGILLDIDNPTRAQIKKALDVKRHHDKNKLQFHNGLILPGSAIEHLKDYCQGCGQTFRGKQKAYYFEQEFCVPCVEKWSQGYK